MYGLGRGISVVSEDIAPMGRGQLMKKMAMMKLKLENTNNNEVKETKKSFENGNKQLAKIETNTETLSEEIIPVDKKRGKAGQPVSLMVNYIELETNECGVYMYNVKFNPSIDSVTKCKAMLYKHTDIIGNGLAFDGCSLFLPIKLDKPVINLKSETRENTIIEIQITFIKVTPFNQLISFYNILFNKILTCLKYEKIGKNYYNPDNRLAVPTHDLEIWPGYVTHVNSTEAGILLQCDTSHRVVSTKTVYQMMKYIYSKHPGNFSKKFSERIIGLIVVTRYNNKTYRIDDFSTDMKPTSEFTLRNGKSISYMEYYKVHYNIVIEDHDQPLLFSKPKRKGNHPGDDEQTQIICLIPELCFITGLTDELRSDFRVMKDLSIHTRMTPAQRVRSLRKFCENVNDCKEAKKELTNWGLTLKTNLIEMTGRVLPKETIYFGGNQKYVCDNTASWNRDVCRKRVVTSIDVNDWLIIYTSRDSSRGQDFIKVFPEVTVPMGIKVRKPRIVVLNNDKIESYVVAIRKNYTNTLQLVVIIFPTARDDKYNAIKRICTSEKPVLSQVIISNTLKPNKLRSVVQKIGLQINCKLGGELWTLNIPSKVLMVCGVDVYHDSTSHFNSVVGFVSSMNSTCSRWYSSVKMQSSGEEIINCLNECFYKALNKYLSVNGKLPERIFLYRDGVGDDQINVVNKYETPQMLDVFKKFGDDYNPKLTVIVCQKRINAKIMKNIGRGDPMNPEPGTIVDYKITRNNMIDFFLISQHVTQGTVTPTHYIVVHDTSEWSIDNIQKMTYKFTHMYYNWPGTIRTPAPCQYAHKIAYQVGQNTKIIPNDELCDKLFYL